MCGRFTLSQSPETIATVFQLPEPPRLEPRYNIAPTQPIAAIRTTPDHPDRQFTYFYWGLIPSWAKDPSMGVRMINARAETVTEKPAFRTAFKRRRCLVVADGFYEWQQVDSQKQPYYFQLADHQPFAFAGLWERWESGKGAIESCTILTTVANDLLQPIHDRMPVILAPQDYQLWLDPHMQNSDRLTALLNPYPAEAMNRYPVSPIVNNARHEGADCIEPIGVGGS